MTVVIHLFDVFERLILPMDWVFFFHCKSIEISQNNVMINVVCGLSCGLSRWCLYVKEYIIIHM